MMTTDDKLQDDHSRFITGSIKIWNPAGENAILLLDRAVRRFGVPEQILTDQGIHSLSLQEVMGF